MEIKQQKGFTLVEIAIVLVIIGLLLGGILKGQELINSARVRNLADQNSGVQAAYYGFIDRYRRIPGDFPAARASAALGVQVFLPDTTPSPGESAMVVSTIIWRRRRQFGSNWPNLIFLEVVFLRRQPFQPVKPLIEMLLRSMHLTGR